MQHVRPASLGERLPLLDAEAVLLVDDGDREVAQLDAFLDERVRADDDVGAERTRASRFEVALVSSAHDTPSARHRCRAIVRKCCSASVSVGAMSAPCRPFSTARSSAYSATTVLPEPTSPCSSRCIGTVRARSASISRIACSWYGVSANGRALR